MADPLSDDVRERACQAVAEGLSGRQAAKRFKASASSVSRWRRRLRDTGSVSPDAMGGDRRSERIEAHGGILLGRMRADPDTTLEENLERCSGRGLLLIQAYMSKVEWTKGGRCLRMVLRNEPDRAAG